MIRPATSEDSESIVRVNVASWQVGYKDLIPQKILMEISVEERLKRWQRAWHRDGFKVLVKELNQEIIGYCAYGPLRSPASDKDNIGEIYSLYLLPIHWQQGFGTDLLSYANANLKREGFNTLMIWVLEGNQRAIRFYQKRGFQLDGTRKRREIDHFSLIEVGMVSHQHNAKLTTLR